jgi:hypothetical protein
MPINDYKDVSVHRLDPAREGRLADGASMSYLYRDGRFWLTASGERKRLTAIRRDQCGINQ